MRVLLAVATRHGATREIAEQVALAMTSALNEADVRADVDVLDVAHVTAVTGYDVVVLGSAVYIGHWLEAARHLAREHRDEWRRVPVWLFSSRPVGELVRPGEGPVDVTDVPAATGAHAHRLSDGKIDRAALHCPERAFVTALRVPDGDNRDWPMIKAWGRENAAELIALPSGLLVVLISLAWFGRRAPAS